MHVIEGSIKKDEQKENKNILPSFALLCRFTRECVNIAVLPRPVVQSPVKVDSGLEAQTGVISNQSRDDTASRYNIILVALF